jgi:hypothetical protein
MKDYVIPDNFSSDYFEIDDDITEDEANEIVCQWGYDDIAEFLERVKGEPMPWVK